MSASYTHFGKNHLHFNEINSTNTFAKELLSKTKPMDGTVISADFQTNGRGQFDRKWIANASENAILTIIVYPDFLKVFEQFKMSKMISISLIETLMHFGVQNPKIKWPNDIYVGNNKICGILIENQISENKLSNMIIGIGINVNQIKFGEKINACSIATETNQYLDIQLVNNTLINFISKNYHELKQKKLRENEYEKYLLKMDKIVNIKLTSEDEHKYAMINGVDDFGRILLSGKPYMHGEVEINYFTDESQEYGK